MNAVVGLLPAPARVLFINVSRIGDTLLMTPAVRAVARAWPQAAITLLAHPKRAEVLQHLPFVAAVGTIDKRRAPLRGRFGRRRFDLAFVHGYDAPLLAYALRVAERVVAFEQPDAALNAKLFAAVTHPPPQTEHAARIQLRLPAAVGVAPAGLRLAYQVTDEERREAAARLAAAVPAGAAPLVGLQIASFPTKAYRDWPAANFAALCQAIRAERTAAHFLIFGGAAEQARTRALAAQLGAAATHYAGALSLRETAALMSRLDLYVGVDTGPTHIMGSFDVPLVALYHGYSPSRVLAPLEHPCCHPVDHPRADRGCGIDESMAEITVERVLAAVRQALAARPR